MDLLAEKRKKMSKAYLRVNKRDQVIFRVSEIEDMKDSVQSKGLECFDINDINKEDKNKIYKQLIPKLRSKNQNLENQIKFLGTIEKDENNYWIEFHRKFALSVTLVILFFMGASLGSIIKKGGFGAPVVIAAVIFILYFSIITTGENLADSQVISPFFGMWMPCIIFTPIAIILTRAAARDSKVFAKENWNTFFKIKKTT